MPKQVQFTYRNSPHCATCYKPIRPTHKVRICAEADIVDVGDEITVCDNMYVAAMTHAACPTGDEYEVIADVAVALTAIPKVQKFFRDLYLECTDTSVLDEVEAHNDGMEITTARKDLVHEVDTFTMLYIRDAMHAWRTAWVEKNKVWHEQFMKEQARLEVVKKEGS